MLQVKGRGSLFLHLTEGRGSSVVVTVVIVTIVVILKVIIDGIVRPRPNSISTQVQSHLSTKVQHHFSLLMLVMLILLLVLRVLLVTALILNAISMLTYIVVIARVGVPCNVAVAAVTEVETLLSEVEALIVRASQV